MKKKISIIGKKQTKKIIYNLTIYPQNPYKQYKCELPHLKIFGKELIDSATIEQMIIAMKLPVSVKGVLLPDAHVGYGLPIGGVLATYNSVIPYAVGMDIGCRMCLSIYPVKPGFIEKNKEYLKKIIIENTRFGKAEFSDIKEHPIMESKEFQDIPFIKSLKDKAFYQLGTSGGGNHFADIGYVKFDESFPAINVNKGEYLGLLTHSGSRNFGAEIAKHYLKIAQKKRALTKGPSQLAWLELNEEEGVEYWKAMTLAGDYSAANHKIIHQKFSSALGEKPLCVIENHHNYAWLEEINNKEKLVIHRKGATPANKGTTGIIPGSMASPAYIISGKGYEESLNSASHGAGRIISRRTAKAKFNQKELYQELKRKKIDLIGGNIDESPNAYKNINEIMKYQKDMVHIIGIFNPKIVRMEGN